MAYSHVQLSQQERDLATANKPILASMAGIGGMDATIGTGWTWTGEPDSLSNPATRLVDGLPGLKTKPGGAGGTNHTLTMAFPAGLEFDFIAIVNHNFDTFGSFDLSLRVADDFAFTSNVVSPLTANGINPSDGKRLVYLELDHVGGPIVARRYSAVAFVQLRMLNLSVSSIPSIGQLVLGRRRQLLHEPDRPWDPSALISGNDGFTSRSGTTIRTNRFAGARVMSGKLVTYIDSFQTDLAEWFAGTNYGSHPYVWIDKPTANPQGCYIMHQDETALPNPFIEWNTREFRLEGTEQGPNFVALE